jgi:succinyl-CoA synthetase beta subunit
MNVHEYQAKQILRKFGVPTLAGDVAFTHEEARTVAKKLNVSPLVVKAQIHAGGRGKAGGVKLVKSPDEAADVAKNLLGKRLVTHQTGPEGREVKKVLVETGCEIARELYVSVLVDRATSRPVVLASTEGGVEIETVAAKSPEKILRETIDPAVGLMPFQARKLAYALKLDGDLLQPTVEFLRNLYTAFAETDASLIEINPLVVTRDGKIVALDAKMSFDDNGLFRHKDIFAMRDLDEEDPKEVEASKFNLNYIRLDGNIGCMVNGAGLAMATMDIIKFYGGAPANFLDVGGGANAEQVTAAFKILLSDANVRAVLINIFGGIMKCDVIAEGVITAAKAVKLDRPLVVRLEGTNVEKGKAMLRDSGLPIITADSLADAAQKVVGALR